MVRGPSSAVRLETNSTYLAEVWAWWAIGVVIILARFAVRIRTVGFREFQGDDYFAILSLGFWTANVAIVQITYYTGGALDVTAEQVAKLSDTDISILTYGATMEFVSWYTYSGMIWTLKFQILFFYKRLKSTLWWNDTVIHSLFWLVIISWAVLLATTSLTCRPYYLNWQVRPLPGPECTFRAQNFWVLVFLNVSTDIAIMIVPLPILWHLRASYLRKAVVSLLLLSGLFMIITAIVRAIITLSTHPSVITINRWGFRETAVGMIAANSPILVPLFTRAFWRKGSYRPQARPDRGLYLAIPKPRHRKRPGAMGGPITLSSIVDTEQSDPREACEDGMRLDEWEEETENILIDLELELAGAGGSSNTANRQKRCNLVRQRH